MKIHMTDMVAKWYEEELDLVKGDHVRFFARYGGTSTLQSGFSLGIQKEEPINEGASLDKNGIRYFIEESDLWYFDSHDLYINMSPNTNEPEFDYKKEETEE